MNRSKPKHVSPLAHWLICADQSEGDATPRIYSARDASTPSTTSIPETKAVFRKHLIRMSKPNGNRFNRYRSRRIQQYRKSSAAGMQGMIRFKSPGPPAPPTTHETTSGTSNHGKKREFSLEPFHSRFSKNLRGAVVLFRVQLRAVDLHPRGILSLRSIGDFNFLRPRHSWP